MKYLLKNKSILFNGVILLGFVYFFWLMLKITFYYIPFSSTANFLQIKQTEVEQRPEYLSLFYIHVYSSIFVLLFGFFVMFISKKYIVFHRISGKIYVLFTLFLASLSGVYIGFFANGGFWSKLSFILLGLFWFYSTLKAFLEVKKGNINKHQQWMWRSYALCCSAITLRLWKVILVYLFQPNPMDVYQIIAWLGWVPNWLLIEYLIIKRKK